MEKRASRERIVQLICCCCLLCLMKCFNNNRFDTPCVILSERCCAPLLACERFLIISPSDLFYFEDKPFSLFGSQASGVVQG